MADDPHARAAQALRDHPDYRVLRRLQPVTRFHATDGDASSRVGVAVDVETTGLDRDTDKIIELAVQRFRFNGRGRVIQVGQPRVWREDPCMPIDPRITKLTGLTDEDVADQAIDEAAALDILRPTSSSPIMRRSTGPLSIDACPPSRASPGPVRWRSWTG